MNRLALALVIVVGAAACKKAEQESGQMTSDTTQMMADSAKMMGDTTQIMARDTAKKM